MPTFRELGIDLDELPSGPESITPMLNGLPTYSYAKKYKNDLSTMLLCCEAEESANNKTEQFPAPFFFQRVAVLAAESGDKRLEREVCIRFRNAVRRSKMAMKAGGYKAADTSLGPSGQAILKRLKKINAR